MTKCQIRTLTVLFVVMLQALPPYLYAATYMCASSSSGQFNSTPIPGGSTIWFSASLLPSGTPTVPAGMSVYWYMISFGQQPNGLPYECHNYPPVDALHFVTLPQEPQLTYFTQSNSWSSYIPVGLGGDTFLAGCAIPPCSANITADCIPVGGLPGGLPVTWTMIFKINVKQPPVWQWGAAVYSQFITCGEVGECQNFGPLGIKAVDNSSASLSCVNNGNSTSCQTIANSDRAGTPENYEQFVITGGTGAGGSDYTGMSGAPAPVNCVLYVMP
jgi:hypothetical protein